MTAAEVEFLKSEAYQRGWVTGDPKAAYDSAISLSVRMYYDTYNRNSAVIRKLAVPSPAAMSAFLNRPGVAYDGTLQRLATQKWIHLGIVQPYEAWAELRRTDYPVLPQDVIGGGAPRRPRPVPEPSSEITSNGQSYEAVRAKETPTAPVWWGVK